MLELPEDVDIYLDEQEARHFDRLARKLQQSAAEEMIEQWNALQQAAEDWRHMKGDCNV